MPKLLRRHTLSPQHVGLNVSEPEKPDLTRNIVGDEQIYRHADNRPVSVELAKRCDALAVPPAWRNVWISSASNAHLLAYGDDESGRRQYIYHPDWRAACEAAKFFDLPLFAAQLPRLRRRVKTILSAPVPSSEFAIAAVIRLIDRAGLRIGNWRNASEGAVTLADKHVDIDQDRIRLEYPAKGGKERVVEIDDDYLNDAFSHLQNMPGRYVFSSRAEKLRARDVNEFIREITGYTFSAKDF